LGAQRISLLVDTNLSQGFALLTVSLAFFDFVAFCFFLMARI
jgi:hypothetical protein